MKATKFYTIFMLMLLFLVSCQQKETEFKTDSQDYNQSANQLISRPANQISQTVNQQLPTQHHLIKKLVWGSRARVV